MSRKLLNITHIKINSDRFSLEEAGTKESSAIWLGSDKGKKSYFDQGIEPSAL
jgi:hypothetical protein